MKSCIEEILQSKVPKELFDKSLHSAKKKQSYLFEISNDKTILKDWYLQQLTIEYIISFSLQELTLDLFSVLNCNMEKEHPTKSQGTPTSIHIVTHSK